MEVGSLEDDNYDEWIVNLCSFPLIGVNLNSETERKVLIPAKIMATSKANQKSFSFSMVKNYLSNKPTGKTQQPEVDNVRPTKKNSMDSQSQVHPYNN